MGTGPSIGTIRLFAAAEHLLRSKELSREHGEDGEADHGRPPAAIATFFTKMEIADAEAMLRRMGFSRAEISTQ